MKFCLMKCFTQSLFLELVNYVCFLDIWKELDDKEGESNRESDATGRITGDTNMSDRKAKIQM